MGKSSLYWETIGISKQYWSAGWDFTPSTWEGRRRGASTWPLASISAYLFNRARTISTWPPLTAPISIVSPLCKRETRENQTEKSELYFISIVFHISHCCCYCQTSHPVWNIDVGSGVKQVLHNFCVSLLGSDGKGCVVVFVCLVNVWVPLQQLFDDPCVAAFHGYNQSRHWVLWNQEKRHI